MRLLSGLIAARPITATLIGDASLSKRPMKRIAEPLRLMGAEIEGDTPPLTVKGTQLSGIDYQSPVPSAQIKSSVLLAGLRASGETWVHEPSRSRDHTERMLQAMGVTLLERPDGAIGLIGGQTLNPFSMQIPADISSAAFFMVGAALVNEAQVTFLDLSVNPTRTGIFEVFQQVGIPFHLQDQRLELGETVAQVTVSHSHQRNPFHVAGDLVPRLIDEIPVLCILATQLNGTSTIRDARELRVKESDRIAVVADALTRMGAQIEVFEDGMAITGPTALNGVEVDSNHDHRIAMSFAIAGCIAQGTTEIEGAESIQTSFPTFQEDLNRLTT
jgi:3-phosphoshikimate 1-carboxyvinyltransferase